ncbi:hypothetical protein HK100_010877, partial [Physocladia obscura]
RSNNSSNVNSGGPDDDNIDLRRLVESAFAWHRAYSSLSFSSSSLPSPRLPLHPDEINYLIQIRSTINAKLNTNNNIVLKNAWSAFVHALVDALSDIASLEYNRELSDAYNEDDEDDQDDHSDNASPKNHTKKQKPPGGHNNDENDEDNDEKSSLGGDSIFSTSYETLSKGLILTKQEIKLLEYSVSKKCIALGSIVATIVRTGAVLPVRIAYEPRAANEVDMKKGDLISLWFDFDGIYGYG